MRLRKPFSRISPDLYIGVLAQRLTNNVIAIGQRTRKYGTLTDFMHVQPYIVGIDATRVFRLSGNGNAKWCCLNLHNANRYSLQHTLQEIYTSGSLKCEIYRLLYFVVSFIHTNSSLSRLSEKGLLVVHEE